MFGEKKSNPSCRLPWLCARVHYTTVLSLVDAVPVVEMCNVPVVDL